MSDFIVCPTEPCAFTDLTDPPCVRVVAPHCSTCLYPQLPGRRAVLGEATAVEPSWADTWSNLLTHTGHKRVWAPIVEEETP